MSNGLCNEKKNVAQLVTAYGESVLIRTAIAFAVSSTQTGIRLNRDHFIKGSHPLSKHAFIEIVNTTRVHRLT